MRMKSLIFISVILLLVLLGCTKKQYDCEKPFIIVDGKCCIDANKNLICDNKEVLEVPKEEPGVSPEEEAYMPASIPYMPEEQETSEELQIPEEPEEELPKDSFGHYIHMEPELIFTAIYNYSRQSSRPDKIETFFFNGEKNIARIDRALTAYNPETRLNDIEYEERTYVINKIEYFCSNREGQWACRNEGTLTEPIYLLLLSEIRKLKEKSTSLKYVGPREIAGSEAYCFKNEEEYGPEKIIKTETECFNEEGIPVYMLMKPALGLREERTLLSYSLGIKDEDFKLPADVPKRENALCESDNDCVVTCTVCVNKESITSSSSAGGITVTGCPPPTVSGISGCRCINNECYALFKY